MKSYLLAIVISLSLSGCGLKSMFVTEKVVVIETKVPVLVPCKIVSPDRPSFPLEESKKDEVDIFVILKKALAEIELRQGYETKIEAAIKECNK